MIRQILLVGTGGAAGSILRFLIGRALSGHTSLGFPVSTFLINVTGCFLIGVFSGFFLGDSSTDIRWKLLLITGFCGGYTTFSAYSSENLKLLGSGEVFTALGYILLSTVLGISAVWLGLKVMK